MNRFGKQKGQPEDMTKWEPAAVAEAIRLARKTASDLKQTALQRVVDRNQETPTQVATA
jgi:hypothetical protein